jgi:hypothetical protein
MFFPPRPLVFCLSLTIWLLSAPYAAAERTITVTIEPTPAPVTPTAAPFAGPRPAVDVALLLDTSNSMDGLIDQARRQLWTIVNQFAAAQKRGQTPHLRVGLFEYGNTHLPATEGYLRQVVPLTDDLDALSAALFALTTSGGDEYCGQVIDEAVTRLDWSSEPGAYRAIFIAGNEPFTQGPVHYADACRRAIQRGIVVNTIHCGGYDAGMQGRWAAGAGLAEGRYLNIDQDRRAPEVATPYDKVIIELNAKLNETYLWYGQRREALRENQAAQDAAAESASPAVAAERVRTKNSLLYRNVGRDLVDTVKADADVLATLGDEALPEPMRPMAPAEREAFVAEKAEQRAAVQRQIAEATAQRDAFVQQQRQRRAEAESGEATLGDAMTRAVRDQLKEAGFAVDGGE